MSVDWSSEIFVGARVGDVVDTQTVTKTTTKYNENTGVPYSLETTVSEVFVGNTKVEDLEDLLEKNDLEILCADHNQEENTKIIGVEVIISENSPEVIEIDMILLQNAINDVKAKFEKLGITAKAKVFLSNSVSYA